jgi:hypothetical protein
MENLLPQGAQLQVGTLGAPRVSFAVTPQPAPPAQSIDARDIAGEVG